MRAVLAAAEKATRDPQVAMFAVVLALVEDTVGSLASLPLAVEIAAVREGSPPCRPLQRQVADGHPDCIGGSSVTPQEHPAPGGRGT